MILGQLRMGARQTKNAALPPLNLTIIIAFNIIKVMALLWLDKTELLGVLLGIVMCGMVRIFPLYSMPPPSQHCIGIISSDKAPQVGLFFVVVAKMNLLSIEG